MNIPAVICQPGIFPGRALMLILGLYFTSSLTGVNAEEIIPDGLQVPLGGRVPPNTDPADYSAHPAEGGGHQALGAGMWMIEYQYVRMYREDFLDTTKEVTAQEILMPSNGYEYSMAGTDMTIDTHLFMAMHGVTAKVKVLVMTHYRSNTLGMLGAGALKSTMRSSGLGDTILSAMVQGPYNLTATGGLSLPTGKIDNAGPLVRGPTPDDRDDNVRYPYSMQLGSGTYDLILGLDYTDTGEKSGWGLEYEYTLRTGRNAEGYTLGDRMLLGTWYKSRLTAAFDTTTKLLFHKTGQIEGEDKVIREEPVYNKLMSPDRDAGNYGGRRLDLGLAATYQTKGLLRFGAEFTLPLSQNLFGPQMAMRWISELTLAVMF